MTPGQTKILSPQRRGWFTVAGWNPTDCRLCEFASLWRWSHL